MTTNSQIAIGLFGFSTVVASVTSTPTQVLNSPYPSGRHMIVLLDGTTYIGSFDLFVVRDQPGMTINMSNNCYMTSSDSTNWHFPYGETELVVTYDYTENEIYLECPDTTLTNITIKEFYIPGESVADSTIYGIDTLRAHLSASGSPVTCISPLVVAYTGANAINFGQDVVTQDTSITTSVITATPSCKIVTVSATTAAGSTESFTLNNNCITTTGIVLVSVCDYTGTGLPPVVTTSSISAGSCTINVCNPGSSSLDGVVSISVLCC